MSRKRKLLRQRTRASLQRLLRPINIAGKKRRFKKSERDLANFMKSNATEFGMSNDEFVKFWFKQNNLYGVIESDIHIEPFVKYGQIYPVLLDLNDFRFNIPLKLSYYHEEVDPLYNIVPELCKTKGIGQQKFLESLYYRFLCFNDVLVSSTGNISSVSNYQDHLGLVNQLHATTKWMPYNWCFPLDYEKDYAWKFLGSGYYPERSEKKSISIRLQMYKESDYESNAIILTLEHLCFIFSRSRSSMFQLLMLHFLKELRLLNDDYEPIEGWREKLADINVEDVLKI